MNPNKSTLGFAIAEARKHKKWSLRELAGRVKKEDAEPITAQYLNDIEKDRRTPSPHVISALADVLGLHEDALLLMAGEQPEGMQRFLQDNPHKAEIIARAFRKAFDNIKKQA